MTNDMKEKVIKYLTGNLLEESPSETLVYSDVETITSNLASQLSSNFSSGYTVKDIIQGRNINGNNLNYSVLYGYYTSGASTRGFIAIIDELGNLIEVIKKFSSNANIGEIKTLNVDEEGNFYMIEYGLDNAKYRFVMMNNIVVKPESSSNYKATIRKAYAIPNTTTLYTALNTISGNVIFNIIKATNQAKYAIFFETKNGNYFVPALTELIINVGAENEWNEWQGGINSISGSTNSITITGTYATWFDDNINFIILTQPNNYPRYIAKYYKNGTSMSYTNIQIETTGFVNSWGESSLILNNTTAYATLSYRTAGSYVEFHSIYKINLSNNTSTTLYSQSGSYDAETLLNRVSRFILLNIDGEILFEGGYKTDELTQTYMIEVGRIREDSDYYTDPVSVYSLIEIQNLTLNSFYIFYVNKQFNLYNINILLDNSIYNTYQIYNRNNYNGTPYENVKSLLPNSAILYNEDNKPIFARNLYNKVINNGTTMSTVEVPYNYINDITIAKQDLLSYNNNVMIDNEENITTNQYEELNINFINTILMSNENIPTRPILNRNGATRLNNSMSDTLDYEDILIDKIRLVYEDNTTYVKAINKATQISDFVYQYTFNVYVPNNNGIKEIELISDDEDTIYQTIDFSNYEKGKTYKISQNVEIQ